MAIALDTPFAAPSVAPTRPMIRLGTFAVPAIASLGAGAIHAAAVGTHASARQAAVMFAVVGAVQLGLGIIALVSHRKRVGIALAIANFAALLGWAMAKRSGIGFVDGMEEASGIEWADGLAAGFAAAAVIGVAVTALRSWRFPASDALVRVIALPAAAVTVVGMIAVTGGHHAAGAEAGADHHGDSTATAASATDAPVAAVPPKPFIPGQPVDLGGVPGVTPEQQAEAENILERTLYYLPQFADPAEAEARGWRSIGDGVTGEEHFVNPATFDDGKILDPTAPESLVYDVVDGKRTLAAAMYMLEPGKTLDEVPKIGGALMQWHIHDNLCFNSAGAVAGLRPANGDCPPGLVKGGETPMIHVWIRSNECGPFAALQGIGGGTIAEGETRLCDTAHGH